MFTSLATETNLNWSYLVLNYFIAFVFFVILVVALHVLIAQPQWGNGKHLFQVFQCIGNFFYVFFSCNVTTNHKTWNWAVIKTTIVDRMLTANVGFILVIRLMLAGLFSFWISINSLWHVSRKHCTYSGSSNPQIQEVPSALMESGDSYPISENQDL